MSNSFTQSVDLAPVQTVVDAIRAADVPALAAILTDIEGAGFFTGTDSLAALEATFDYTATKVQAIDLVTVALELLLPAEGTLEINTDFKEAYITVSDELRHSNDAEKTTDQVAYVILKEIICVYEGTIRVSFDLKRIVESNTAYGKIYKNGGAVGIERINGTTTYETFSEDLDFVRGDLIQLYGYTNGGGVNCSVRNFRLYGDLNFSCINTME